MNQLKFKHKICLTIIESSSVFLTVFLNQMISTVFPAYPSVQSSFSNDSVISSVGLVNCTIENPSNVFVAVLIGSKYSTELVMFPIVGWLADKYFPPLILFCGAVVETFACIAYSISGNFYVTIAARIIDAVGYSILSTSALTIVYVIYSKEQSRNKVITIDSILVYIAASISPVIAGSIFEQTAKFGHDASRVFTFMSICPFFLCLSIVLIPFAFRNSCFSLYFNLYEQTADPNQIDGESESLHTKTENHLGNGLENSPNTNENHVEANHQQSAITNEVEVLERNVSETEIRRPLTMRTLLRDAHIIIVLLCLTFNSLIGNSLETTLPIFMIRKFCSDQRQQGTVWLFGFLSLFGFFLSSIIFHKKPKVCWGFPMIGLMINGILCILISYSSPWWAIGVCLGIIFFFSSMTEVLLIPLVAKIIDVKYSKAYGSGSGLTLLTFTISGLMGTFPVGFLVEKFGFLTLCSLLCSFTFILAPFVMFLRNFFT